MFIFSKKRVSCSFIRILAKLFIYPQYNVGLLTCNVECLRLRAAVLAQMQVNLDSLEAAGVQREIQETQAKVRWHARLLYADVTERKLYRGSASTASVKFMTLLQGCTGDGSLVGLANWYRIASGNRDQHICGDAELLKFTRPITVSGSFGVVLTWFTALSTCKRDNTKSQFLCVCNLNYGSRGVATGWTCPPHFFWKGRF